MTHIKRLTSEELAADKERLEAFIQERVITTAIAQRSIELEAARQRNREDKLVDRGFIGYN